MGEYGPAFAVPRMRVVTAQHCRAPGAVVWWRSCRTSGQE